MKFGKWFAASRRIAWLHVTPLVFLVGCDRGPKQVHLSGQILFQGERLPAGEIYFDPDFRKGMDGRQGFARIEHGHYDTRKMGVPLAAGPHIVRILGFDGKTGPDAPYGSPLISANGEFVTGADVPASDATLDFDIPRARSARP